MQGLGLNKNKIDLDLEDEKAACILGKALDGESLSKKELMYLATRYDTDISLAMFQVARRICERNFGKKVFLYGFVYFSTFCRNLCAFCYYRKDNKIAPRYRKKMEEVLEAVDWLIKSGVHLVDLTMGEDPQICEVENYKPLLDLCREIKRGYDHPLMLSPGVVPPEILSELSNIGVDWYALYQETYNRELFAKLKPGQSFEERLRAKIMAREKGLLVEDGILLGIGEDEEDVVDSIFMMKSIKAQQVRVMGFQPQPGTPLEKMPPPPILEEMRTIAMMRLVHQDRLIPASYDIDGLKGLELRIMAGANVVTSLVPPNMGFHGVAQPKLDIDGKRRTVEGVLPYLRRLGLEPATKQSYQMWLEKEKEIVFSEREGRVRV